VTAAPALQLRGLDAAYGPARVLFGVDLEVASGQVAALLGRNGAGKSTTLKSVIGLVPRRQGEVRLFGELVTSLPTHRIAARGIGYVAEERRVFPDLTVLENLEVGRQKPRPGVAAWTTERLFAVFPSLAPLRQRPAGQMSGGEQQMLAIARALMGNPLLLLLDEPSEGLAPVIVARLANAVRELKAAGIAILLAEQNLRFAAAVADHAYVLEKGRIAHQDAMAALMVDDKLRTALLGI
jgi:branched-chain amino acid transport system ATP-binding protein